MSAPWRVAPLLFFGCFLLFVSPCTWIRHIELTLAKSDGGSPLFVWKNLLLLLLAVDLDISSSSSLDSCLTLLPRFDEAASTEMALVP
jgi:hypothetical protein